MRAWLIVHRWFSSGEGWAYADDLPDALRQTAAEAISRWMRDNSTGELRRREEYILLWLRNAPDLNCPDPLAMPRNPFVTRCVVYFPAPVALTPDHEAMGEDLFILAETADSAGAQPGWSRAMARPEPVPVFSEKKNKRFSVGVAVAVVIALTAIAMIIWPRGRLREAAPEKPPHAVPPTSSPVSSVITEERQNDPVHPPEVTRTGGEQMAAAGAWREKMDGELLDELKNHRRFQEFRPDSLNAEGPGGGIRRFLELHSQEGLRETFGIDDGQPPLCFESAFLKIFPKRPLNFQPESERELLRILYDLAGLDVQVRNGTEVPIATVLEAIRERFDFRRWFAKEWYNQKNNKPFADTATNRNLVFLSLSFSPKPSSIEKNEARALARIFTECRYDAANVPDDAIEMRPWLVYAAFFNMLDSPKDISRSSMERFLGQGDAFRTSRVVRLTGKQLKMYVKNISDYKELLQSGE